MQTKYTILYPDGQSHSGELDWPEQPSLKRLIDFICPLLGDDEPLEHVAVLDDGRRKDMFVSELGHLERTSRAPLPLNPAATAIYRNNWLTLHPETNPDTLPDIAGVAVLFDRIVWF